MIVIALFTSGCGQSTVLVGTNVPKTVDVRYISQIPLAELEVAVFDTNDNPLNGNVKFRKYGESPTLGSFNVSEGRGVYNGKTIKSNVPYEYSFSSDGYYASTFPEVAKIPIQTIDENVSLNWSFVFPKINKKGNVAITIRDYYTGQKLHSPIKINLTERIGYSQYFRLEVEMTPFVFSPYVVLTDGTPFDKYDDSYYRFVKDIYCWGDTEYGTRGGNRVEVPDIRSRKKIDCELAISFSDTYGLNGTDFVFFYATKDYNGRYFDFENISNVVKFEVVR